MAAVPPDALPLRLDKLLSFARFKIIPPQWVRAAPFYPFQTLQEFFSFGSLLLDESLSTTW